MKPDNSNRESTSPCKIVSKYFSDILVMDESSKEVKKEKQSTSKKPQVKTDKIRKRPSKRSKGQKDIRTLIKSKKNELLTYSEDFDLICKQSGIDVDPEQLQLAIALSKSIEDNKSADNGITDNPQITIPAKSLSCNQRRNKIRTTLQEYGFQTKTAPTKKVKRYRKHYKLVLVSDTEKQQKIADKYAEILIKNVALAKGNEDSGCKNNYIDSYLYNLTTNVSYDYMKNDEIFYICDLVPKSLHEKHNFKDWSEIPGRPVSPKFEEPNHRFKDIECSQEQLDNILSGSIDTAHDIVKSNHISNSLKTSSLTESTINQKSSFETESKDSRAEVFSENKSIEDRPISKTIDIISYNNTQTMSTPINRSCSPDLFDDEMTIIMDSSKDTVLVPEGVSSVTVNEQNDFMELTDCIGNINGSNIVSKHIACFSQGSNKTRLSPNDFMDLTECIPACSQKRLHTPQSTSSYEKPKENFSVIKENNPPDIIDLNQSTNFVNNEVNSGINEKSLDDTIIMIEEDYNNINTGNKINVANVTFKDSIIIDLSESQCLNSRILNTAQPKHSHSIVDLEGSPEFHNDQPSLNKPDNNKIIPGLVDCKENSEAAKDTENLDTVDLTQPNFEKCLSHVNVTSVQSIATYDIHSEFDLISSKGVQSENSNCNKNDNRNENAKDEHDGSEKCGDVEEMDLTQSSNSEDCIQVVHEASVNNRLLDDTIIFNNEHHSINLIIPDKHYSDINSETIQNTEHKKTNTENTILTIIDAENDSEFDNLVKNVSNSKQTSSAYGDKFLNDDNSINLLHKSTVENDPENQEIDLTQNHDCSIDRLSGLSNLSNKSENIDDNAYSRNVEEQIHKNTKKLEEKSHKPKIGGTSCLEENMKQNKSFMDIDDEFDKVCSHISKSIQSEDNDQSDSQYENILNEDGQDSQNSDIDLTQQSDSSVDTYRSPSNIEVPCELGQKNNISIDYDELYDKENITKNDERTSSSDTNKSTNNDKISSKDHRVSGSSLQSEVFELSDNEFNYSINQHMQDNESSTLKQAKFDIGGLSIIDDFFNRNSFPRRSKLRCSCSSNIEPNANDNEVESCLPMVDNTENIEDYNVNKESKACEEVTFVKISTPLKSKSDDNILIAKTPKHDDYIIKTDQVTPMPNYEHMTSPERNEELDKFGIKPLKRKRAIQILTHIYNQTHPLMEVLNDECSSPSKIRRTNNAESFPRRAIASQIDSVIAKHSVESTTDPLEILEPDLAQKPSKPRKDLGKDKKSPKSSSSKETILYEETISVPDIRNIECSPEDWVFQKREKAKVHSCRVPLHIAFHNYVSCRKALREAILRYEPINIDDIHKGLVAIGYRYNPKDLLKFMDRKCITVKTADNAKKNKNP